MGRNRGGPPRHLDILTPAEQRVLEELRAGGANAEIGDRLGISPEAVEYHVSNMLGKLALGSRRELASWRPGRGRGRLSALAPLLAAGSAGRAEAWGAAVLGVVAIGLAAVAMVGATGPLLGGGADATVVAMSGSPSLLPPAGATSVTPASPPTPEPAAAPPTPAGPSPTATSAPAATPTATAFAPRSTALAYNRFDATGEALAAGSYAFLSDPADLASAITTYEELRDGTTRGVIINTSDARGASHGALYDAVRAGDLFEWREADDCFVRYTVTEVKPEPTGAAPRKLLAVEWMTYAFTGCRGAVSTGAAAMLDWGELPDLGGTGLSSPVRHGPFQIVPEDWSGVVEPPESHQPASYDWDIVWLSDPDPAVAQSFPYWREPAPPSGWRLRTISRGTVDDPSFGYTAEYATPEGYRGVRISGYYAAGRGWAREASWSGAAGILETRVVDGRPTLVMYSPPGPHHNELFPLKVWIYDPATESEYLVAGEAAGLRGANVDAVIAIARSLFESPNPQ